MKATILRAKSETESGLLATMQKKLDDFLSTPVDDKLPVVRFICQSEHTPEKMAGLRAISTVNPHITITILWE